MVQTGVFKRPQCVLVVDDYESNREALGKILEHDYEVLYAENGKEALEIMSERSDDLSIVLLDLIMPVMNGFAVMDQVQEDERLRGVPIVVLTTGKDIELKALRKGAADIITKPFDAPDVILARVGRIIELNEGRELISAAEQDRLTGLLNSNFFFEYASRLVQYHPELRMDAVVLDIEQFHSVNELNGRDFGDRVLGLIGEEIRAFLLETEGIASRFEADHFGIYCAAQDDYRQLLERFQAKVNDLSPTVNIHLRMGVSRWQEGVDPVVMFDHARAACNRVRGDYWIPLMEYDEVMRKRELLNQRLLNDLRVALHERQLEIYYQPKYEIQVDPPRLHSAEALIRWQHPELGLLTPNIFIPLFEGNGLISIVDYYVWREAARQIRAWRDAYGITLPVSVNLSRADVFDQKLIGRLQRLVEDNGLDYRDLKLELTESAYTDNAAQVLEVVRRLREKGFLIEMDDFGSGYSSLNMLSDMPVDVLKMDMQFVRNIEKNETDLLLVKLILDIARYLKMEVIAEGVETQGQLDLLREGGCDLVQGYYFSRPLPAAEFEELMRRELVDGARTA